MATVNFSGRWQETESTNKEEFCRACGLSAEMAKVYGDMKPIMEIKHDGKSFHTKETAPDGSVVMEEEITIGVPYSPKLLPPGVKKMEFVLNWTEDGKTLRSVITNPGESMVTNYYFGDDGNLVIDSTVSDITCTGHYTKA